MEEKQNIMISGKLTKARKSLDPKEMSEKLEQLRKWALAGISIFELPEAVNKSSNETGIDSALMQYCYYRLLYYLAGKILFDLYQDNLKDSKESDVARFILSPIGCGVTDKDIIFLCESIVNNFKPYSNDSLFGNMTAYDVADSIRINQSVSKRLLVEAILNPL